MAKVAFNPGFGPRITDTAGRPIAGAKAKFYLSNTTTLTTVYSDAAGSALTNPVVADAYGLLPKVFYDDGTQIKVVFTDADDATIDQCDPINLTRAGLSPISAVSGDLYEITAADNGKIIRRTHSGAMTDELPAANAVSNGYGVTLWNVSTTQTDTVSVDGGGTINGSASLIVQPGQRTTFISDGSSAWYAAPQSLTEGFHSEAIPIGAWRPTESNPANSDTMALRDEGATDGFNFDYMVFDDGADSSAYCQYATRLSYKPGTMKFRVWAEANAGTPGQTFKFTMAARCIADGGTLDDAYGAGATVTDALQATGLVQVTDWTAFTPDSDGAGCLLGLKLTRTTSGQTLAEPVAVFAVEVGGELYLGNDA